GLILIRALEPRRGSPLMKRRRGIDDIRRLCSGPGKLTQALDITNRHHEKSICAGTRHYLLPRVNAHVRVVADPRVGISRSKDYPWRFTLAESDFVSRPVRIART
ncbi:MAG TPA: DNA-3-methyladenine glycosylase, partial [Chthoniobacterales bacterium]|nr:DNA-3-methyladenine glycosylase [Chthoniobacterales bacterium]